MNISFGNKIPISNTQIYDKNKNAFVDATVYEIDCKDEEDVNYLSNGGIWAFKMPVMIAMKNKHRQMSNYDNLSDFEKVCANVDKFYSIETEDNVPRAYCEIMDFPYGNTDIKYIESDQQKLYKYAGTALIASLAKQLAKYEGRVLCVSDPATEAETYYKNALGFEKNEGRGYHLDSNKIKNFVEEVERKTAPIVDVIA